MVRVAGKAGVWRYFTAGLRCVTVDVRPAELQGANCEVLANLRSANLNLEKPCAIVH